MSLPTASSSTRSRSIHRHKSRLWANAEQRLGYNSQSTLFSQFIVTPFLGLGWHYEQASHDHDFWYYGAGGLKILQQFSDQFSLGVDLKAMYAFDIHDGRFVSIITTQGKKAFWGFETALPLRWLVGASGHFDLEFKPYLLKFNLNSPQTIVGARLVVGYSF